MADFKNRALLLRRGIRTFPKNITIEGATQYAGFQIANAAVSYFVIVLVLTLLLTILCWPVFWKLLYELLALLLIIIIVGINIIL